MRRQIRTLIPLAAVLAIGLIAPGSASALSCGANLTHSVKLTANMDCSASNTNGIDVGKAGITINLNHHTLTGPGGAAGYDGISNRYDGVTVENGTVKNYETDVYFEYASRARIIGVHTSNDGGQDWDGIDLEYGRNSVIKRSTATNAADGIYVYETGGVSVVNSKVTSSYIGFYIYYGRATVKHSRAIGNGTGIYTYEAFTGTKVLDSTANGNTDGIYVYENYPATLYSTSVTGNVANGNSDYGMYAELQAPGSGNRAHGNSAGQCYHVPCNRKPKHKGHHGH